MKKIEECIEMIENCNFDGVKEKFLEMDETERYIILNNLNYKNENLFGYVFTQELINSDTSNSKDKKIKNHLYALHTAMLYMQANKERHYLVENELKILSESASDNLQFLRSCLCIFEYQEQYLVGKQIITNDKIKVIAKKILKIRPHDYVANKIIKDSNKFRALLEN